MRKPLFKIRENGKFGFMDATGEIVIEPQYYEAEDFHNGFSRVRFNNKLVPLDSLGRLLMKHLFNFVGLFEEGFAKAQLVNQW
ncbi:MAG: WG repeat-containing protein, partial [Bacteroidetes bacterium]